MNRTQRAALKKERHDRQVARRLEKKRIRAQAPDPEDEDIDLEAGDVVEPAEETPIETPTKPEIEDLGDEEDEEDFTDPAADHPRDVDNFAEATVKKDMWGQGTEGIVQDVPAGPTSWEELDAAQAAQEQAHEIHIASYNVEDLVRNILDSDNMDAGAKAKAIQAVGSGFKGRVDTILSGGEPGAMKKDADSIELLELEAIIAYDNRHTAVGEKMSDFITKAVLTTAGRNKLSAGQFALVRTSGGKTIKKYPIHDKAHVRNALARAAQQIKRGGQGAADARAALPKIHAAAKRMGIGMGKDLNSTIVLQKDAKGEWRWVGWPSNNFKDLQGDIISKEAHQEFVEFLDANPSMAPLFMTWHTPGTQRKHPVDYWNFEKGFLIMSGVLEEDEAKSLFKAMKETDLGMSFQGFGLREDTANPHVVTKYRAYEVSDLPLDHAANPFTDFSVIVKEVDMDKKAYLATILGSNEAAEAYLAKAGLKQQALENAGVESKSTDGKVTEPAPAQKVEAKIAAAATAAKAAPAEANALVEAVLKELGADELSAFVAQAQTAIEKVEVLEGVVKDLQGKRDENLATMISPPAKRFAWMAKSKASESEETKVDENDELVKKVPGLGPNWLSEVTGTNPIEVEPVRA